MSLTNFLSEGYILLVNLDIHRPILYCNCLLEVCYFTGTARGGEVQRPTSTTTLSVFVERSKVADRDTGTPSDRKGDYVNVQVGDQRL